MALPELEAFTLVGGTALSLQIGHRISVDLDLFGKSDLPHQEIIFLLSDFSSPQIVSQTKNILILNIAGIKVDFVNYSYPFLKSINISDRIRLSSLEDIAAMKLAAIAGRGRMRDFTDIYFLLKQYTLSELIQFYNNKYPDGSEFMVAKSLSYFEDAEQDEPPNMIVDVDWETIKGEITEEVNRMYR
ncbi:MAG: nucleotidyl transferase AbiEii/AbiGii toxin family protein [Bacteroidota bacterium]